MVKIDMDAIRRLSTAERARLAQEIWDTIPPTAADLPLTAEDEAIIDERLERHRRDPGAAVNWSEAKRRLETE